ncbi:MAG: CHAT domain-containing protein, partial [Candidatus Omnitrophica bacterium]|nr:CHAT domain-containing protein [Candidatus Omnitrophota bacterium]
LIDPSSITPAPRARQKTFDTISRTFFKNSIPKKIAESIQQTTCEFLVFEVDPEAAKIPWELCHDEIDFLCFRFSTGRRFSTAIATKSRTRPQSSEHGSILLISDPTGNLPASCVEGEDLSQFFLHDLGAETTWLTNNVDRLTFSRWLTQFDLLHFSGHFETSLENDEGIGWRLSDGLFTERDLGESIDSEDSLPLLIFNNACQSACFDSVSEKADGQSLLSTILSSGCLHYIGSLSKIDDHWGREFARVFYRHILDGLAVGAALRLARIHVRAADENDPTSWAQYVLYGDPLKGIYGERANFIEARSLVFLENVSEDSILKNVSTVERVPIGNGKNCLLFHLPSEAVRRSLSFLQNGGGMDSNGHESRIAISSGEVSVERCEQSGRALAISGPPVETGESLLGMTGPKQLLATRPVMDDARANVRSEDAPAGSNIVWLDHGFYRHVNIEDPLAVCEIGLEGFSPLSPPVDSEEATRIISPDQEPVLGWRPALDHVIPTAQEWILKEKLGEGGFGEVWLAHHCETSSARVFKFCFKADRVRSLKREVTLFRILKDRLKKQDNIVQIYDVYFEASPFYISMEHVPGLDLGRWCQRYCGDERIEESVRLEIVAKIADSLQAAHDAGLIHRDVKPSNVLVEGTPDSPQNIRIKLTDFGIGQVQSTQLLMNVTALGFTETFSKTEMSSGSGSRLYMAPRTACGKTILGSLRYLFPRRRSLPSPARQLRPTADCGLGARDRGPDSFGGSPGLLGGRGGKPVPQRGGSGGALEASSRKARGESEGGPAEGQGGEA